MGVDMLDKQHRGQAWKWSIRWREDSDRWGGETPDSLEEIESNSLGARVAETNGCDRDRVALL